MIGSYKEWLHDHCNSFNPSSTNKAAIGSKGLLVTGSGAGLENWIHLPENGSSFYMRINDFCSKGRPLSWHLGDNWEAHLSEKKIC